MVGSLLLLKMLHCKRMSSRRTMNDSESTSRRPKNEERPAYFSSQNDVKDSLKKMKKEKCENVCRVCLKEGNIPIYGNEKSEDISEALNTFGGINTSLDDPHPKFLCALCNSLLHGAILFRKTAQQSDRILQRPKTEFFYEENDSVGGADEDTTVNHEEFKVEEQEKYSCKRCDMEFDSFKELDDHKMTDEHENFRRTCPYCYKTYAPLYYKKHLTLHTNSPSYICDICGKKFILQGQFTRHRQIHFFELPFKCSLCPYKGRFSQSLKMHMRSHTGERPYQCTECPSRFINKSNLNKHMLTHKEERDFNCDSCGRGFYVKRDLELHYKVDHGGVKEHVCKVCGKAFGYRKQMMKHELKVHKRAKLRSGTTPLYLKVESMQKQGQDNITES